jgi:HSP20 family protein
MKLIRKNRPTLFDGFGLGRWGNLDEEFERLLGTPFAGLSRPTEFFGEWTPALDLTHDKENFVAKIELPGMEKDDIEVSLHEGVLTISGERKAEEKKEDEGQLRTERVFGSFSRSVRLPKPVNSEKVTASYKDGILTVTAPMVEEVKPKQIDVKVK